MRGLTSLHSFVREDIDVKQDEPSVDTQLAEAYLRSSGADAVYAWWAARPPTASVGNDALDEEHLSRAVSGRNEPLIALALARFCASENIVRAAFEKGGHSGFEFLRLAALTNVRCPEGWLPGVFDGKDERCAEWLSAATSSEINALFGNPRLDADFMAKVLKRDRGYASLNDERLRQITAGLCRNERLKAPPPVTIDGWSWYANGLPISEAWNLATTAPVTSAWAKTLLALYTHLSHEPYLAEDLRNKAIARWLSVPREAKRVSGSLDLYDFLVVEIARPAARTNSEWALTHAEVAVRCAAYAYATLGAKRIPVAAARDGALGVSYLVDNKSLWRRSDSREALRQAVELYPGEHDRNTESLHYARKRFETEHREWFEDDETNAPADKVATQGNLEALKQDLIRSLAAQAKTLQTLTYVAAGMAAAFALAMFRH